MSNTLQDIQLANKTVGTTHRPLIVAEMSGNHNQSLERAIQIVDAAADAGADALKIQTYTADTMTLNIKEGDFFIDDKESLWSGHSLHELYQKAHTPWEWHTPIFEHCKKRGIVGFSAPFDTSAVDFLESLNVPFYKIASFENADLALIRKAAQTGKPVIVSTGLSTPASLWETAETLRTNGNGEFILLKCTSSYPSSPRSSNIRTIPHMRELFGCHVGLSDHTLGIGVPLSSISLGAVMIEKHFTLSRADGGVDAAFSLEPQELKALVEESKRGFEALGHVKYGIEEREKNSLVFKRSIYTSEDIKEGEVLSTENMRVVRPGHGLEPKYFETLIGKHVNTTLKKGTPLNWDVLG